MKFGLLSSLMIIVGTIAVAQTKHLVFTFTATLSGENVASPVETTGSGTVIAILLGNQLTVTGVYQDLGSSLTQGAFGGAVSIGVGPAGEAGTLAVLTAEQNVWIPPTFMTLENSGGKTGTFSGVFTLTDEQIQELGDGLFYVQLHTLRSRSGELRGQLSTDDARFQTYFSTLGDPDLDDPEAVSDITAQDLAGIWLGQTGFWAGDTLQIYENNSWTHLGSLGEAGEVPNPARTWVVEGNVAFYTTHDTCEGSSAHYTYFELLYLDGRRRSLILEGNCQPLGTWVEWVKIDAEGNRVPLRQ